MRLLVVLLLLASVPCIASFDMSVLDNATWETTDRPDTHPLGLKDYEHEEVVKDWQVYPRERLTGIQSVKRYINDTPDQMHTAPRLKTLARPLARYRMSRRCRYSTGPSR